MSVEIVVGTISAVAAVIAATVGFMNQRSINNAQKPHFRLNRVINLPIGTSQQLIEVSHPDKPIENCRVFYDGKPLICTDNIDSRQLESHVFAGGLAQFRLPEKVIGSLNEDALIVVKDGKKTLKSLKLKDVHIA